MSRNPMYAEPMLSSQRPAVMREAGAVTAFATRDARPDDMPALREVYRRASLSNDSDRAQLLAHPDALEFSDLTVTEGRTRAVVADDRLVGFASWRADGPVLEIEDLFVDPDYMAHGIGRGLLLDLLTIARARGADRAEVTAGLDAIGFYHKAGFITDHEVQTRLGPALRMTLRLAP
jgi:GNAT superfamily N-acetyltransferase